MLAALAAAALLASPGVVHLKAREEGRFEPNYDGGDDYVYYDPDLASLDSLPFDHNNSAAPRRARRRVAAAVAARACSARAYLAR